jgi:hypothetical protein
MPSLIGAALWLSAGFYMVYFLAALQNVPGELLDGGHFRQFARRILCEASLPARQVPLVAPLQQGCRRYARGGFNGQRPRKSKRKSSSPSSNGAARSQGKKTNADANMTLPKREKRARAARCAVIESPWSR